jgi:hypothetical protein
MHLPKFTKFFMYVLLIVVMYVVSFVATAGGQLAAATAG